MPISEFAVIITSVKTAYEMIRGMRDLKSEVDRNLAVSKILEVLLSAQESALEVQVKANKLEQEKYELSKKVLEFESWTQTQNQYELKALSKGVFIYAYKKFKDTQEADHFLCTNCFNKRQKSILQRGTMSDLGIHYKCHACGLLTIDPSEKSPIPKMVY